MLFVRVLTIAHRRQGLYLCLVSVVMASWGNDMSVSRVVTTKQTPWHCWVSCPLVSWVWPEEEPMSPPVALAVHACDST